jgi:hypothetical protein
MTDLNKEPAKYLMKLPRQLAEGYLAELSVKPVKFQ